MESNYLSFLCGPGLIISILPLSILFFLLIKKGWLSLRLIALLIFVLVTAVGIVFWFITKDDDILLLMLGVAVLGSLIVLSMRITSPELMKLLKIKW